MAPPSRRGRQRKPVSHYTDDNPSTFTTKGEATTPTTVAGKRRRRVTATSTSQSLSPPHTTTSKEQEQPPPPTRKRPLPPPDDGALVVHEHNVTTVPILPFLATPSTSTATATATASIRGPPPPTWTLLPTSTMDDTVLFPPPITCMTMSGNYLAMSNVLGQVLVYCLTPMLHRIAVLHTCTVVLPKFSKKFRGYNEENAILQMTLEGTTLSLVTHSKVECWNLLQEKLVWSMSVESAQVTKLDLHPTKNATVLCCFAAPWKSKSPCFVLRQEENVTATPILPQQQQQQHTSTTTSGFQKCAAMWNTSGNTTRIVMVATMRNDNGETQELLLLKEDGTVLHSTSIPCKGKSIEAISQSGPYTVVASTRGVRLYRTETLEFLQSHGDGVALHGHSLVYQQAFLMKISKSGDDTTNWVVVGVPHAHREPRELQDSIRVWQWWDTIHPAHTISGIGGLKQVLPHGNALVALTQNGKVFSLRATLKSDWAGVMYPPGYRVIHDNIVYIEDEDAVDIIVDELPEQEAVVVEDELAEAMRRSMYEEEVNVVDCSSSSDAALQEDSLIIPCRVDPRLKQALQKRDTGTTLRSPESVAEKEEPSFVNVLESLPQRTVAKSALERMRNRPSTLEAAAAALPAKAVRGKRSRASNLEAMIKASIDPELRKFMFSKEEWATGEGSSLREADTVVAVSQEEAMQERAAEKAVEDAAMEEKESPPNAAVSEDNDGDIAVGVVAIEATEGQESCGQGTFVLKEGTGPEGMKAGATIEGPTTEQMIHAGDAGTHAALKDDASAEQVIAEVKESTADTGNSVEEKVEASRDKTDMEIVSEVVASRPIDDAATSALEGMLALQRSFSEDASPQKSSASPASKMPPVPPFSSHQVSSSSTSITQASPSAKLEYAEAFNDSGESAETTKPTNGDAPVVVNGMHDGQTGLHVDVPNDAVAGKESFDERTIVLSVPPAAKECADGTSAMYASDAAVGKQVMPSEALDAAAAANSNLISSDVVTNGGASNSDLPIVTPSEDDSARCAEAGAPNMTTPVSDDANKETEVSDNTAKELSPSIFCSACRGRMVIHTCGKKTIPVDFEAIAQAEKEKLEKEEEEKKRLRVEKRRQADARRREAKKQKKREEEKAKRERMRLEEEEERRRFAGLEQHRMDDYDKERRRAEMWQRLRTTDERQREEETYVQQGYVDCQVDSRPAEPLYSAAPVAQIVATEPSHMLYGHYQMNDVQQSHDSTPAQARYSPIVAMQQGASGSLNQYAVPYDRQQLESHHNAHLGEAQPVYSSLSTSQQDVGRGHHVQGMYHNDYASPSQAAHQPAPDSHYSEPRQDQSLLANQHPADLGSTAQPEYNSLPAQHGNNEQQVHNAASYEHAQGPQYQHYNLQADEQAAAAAAAAAAPRPPFMRQASDRWGTAEALASLMFAGATKTVEPTEQSSIHTSDWNGDAPGTTTDSYSLNQNQGSVGGNALSEVASATEPNSFAPDAQQRQFQGVTATADDAYMQNNTMHPAVTNEAQGAPAEVTPFVEDTIHDASEVKQYTVVSNSTHSVVANVEPNGERGGMQDTQ